MTVSSEANKGVPNSPASLLTGTPPICSSPSEPTKESSIPGTNCMQVRGPHDDEAPDNLLFHLRSLAAPSLLQIALEPCDAAFSLCKNPEWHHSRAATHLWRQGTP